MNKSHVKAPPWGKICAKIKCFTHVYEEKWPKING